MDDALQKRGHALEEIFFQEQNKILLEKLRKEMEGKALRETLSSVSGITDFKALEAMVAIGVNAESLVAMTMIPLVAVAWADGVVQTNEKEAILKAAASNSIDSGSAAHSLLQAWLHDRPSRELMDSWKQYIKALKSAIEPAAFLQIKNTVLSRADEIAKSAGGFLGMAAVSESEKKVLNEMQAAFG
ncbi:MAG: hypothetical protein ABL888_07765 [Pirellulaceae bacterium]